ncbi:hypothetical protein Tco_0751465 [Tanacetum coccineum]|uniref:Uncharacterized protein n=1 Tax=Tanacetum coccineum TaxID=301880 RepID=A0ABQ4Z445_9ASTR
MLPTRPSYTTLRPAEPSGELMLHITGLHTSGLEDPTATPVPRTRMSDPEEYEDDETDDGPVDYPIDRDDDRDDDDGHSSRDDANDEDEDDDDEDEDLAWRLYYFYFVVPMMSCLPLREQACYTNTLYDIYFWVDYRPILSFHIPSTRGRGPLRLSLMQDEIPESEQPPRKRLCLSTLGSRYEIGESSTARPTRGRGIDYGFVSTVDAEERRQGIRDVGYGIRDTWVDPAKADLYALLEDAQDRDSMDGGGGGLASEVAWANSIGLSQATHQELQTHHDHVYAHETHLQAHQTRLQLQGTLIQTQHQVHKTRFQMQQAELAALRETDRRRQDQMVETLRVIRDMRREMSDMQAELLSLREQQRRARQPGPEARIPDHQDASGDADSHI